MWKCEFLKRLEQIERKVDQLMATQQELVTTINGINATLTKIGTETMALLVKIEELKDLVAAGGAVTPELQAAVDAVAAQAKTVDDLVPDPAPIP